MGVFIQNMKMPNCCAECPLCIQYKQSSAYCNLLEADINPDTAKARKSLGCTLIEINTSWGKMER